MVNGRQIGPSTDLAALISRQIKGGTALGQQPDEGPETALFALFGASAGTALESRLVEAAVQLLTDQDLDVRAGVVDVIQQFPDMFDSAHLLGVLDAHSDLFQASTGTSRPDLALGILRAIASRPSSDLKIIRRLRQVVIDPKNGSWVLAGVADHDTDWLLSHLPEVVGADTNRARIILFRLRDPALRERLVREIPRESPELRKVMAQAVSEEVTDQKERDRLLELLR